MKAFRLIVLSMAVLLVGSMQLHAQHFIVKAGFTSSQQDIRTLITETIQMKGANIKGYNSFQIGVGYQTAPLLGFTFQPEFVFNKKGAAIADNVNWDLSYLQVPVNIQWGPDLIICRPFLQVTPFVGYCVSNKLNTKPEGSVNVTTMQTILKNITDIPNKFEYGLALGGGIEVIDRLQLTVKYAWNFGKVSSYQQYWQELKNVKDKASSLEVTLGVMF